MLASVVLRQWGLCVLAWVWFHLPSCFAGNNPCAGSAFWPSGANPIPRGLAGVSGNVDPAVSYPNEASVNYTCAQPAGYALLGGPPLVSQLYNLRSLRLSTVGQSFSFFCNDGTWNYRALDANGRQLSTNTVANFDRNINGVECRAVNFCLYPPDVSASDQYGLHSTIVATGNNSVDWVATSAANIPPLNGFTDIKQARYVVTCDSTDYILRDGLGNDVTAFPALPNVTCNGFDRWLLGAESYQCYRKEQCDPSQLSGFSMPSMHLVGGSFFPSDMTNYGDNTAILSCNDPNQAIYDKQIPADGQHSLGSTLFLQCIRDPSNNGNAFWQWKVGNTIYPITVDVTQRLTCATTTTCSSPPSPSTGAVTPITSTTSSWPVGHIDFVYTCPSPRRLIDTTSNTLLVASQKIPLTCVGGNIQWDCTTSPNYPYSLSNPTSCLTHIQCMSGCSLTAIFDGNFNGGVTSVSFSSLINHTINYPYDAWNGESVQPTCAQGLSLATLSGQSSSINATCVMDNNGYHWNVAPASPLRCTAPNSCIGFPDFPYGRLAQFIPPSGSTTFNGQSYPTWDASMVYPYRALCPFDGYERQVMNPSSRQLEWALGGINIACQGGLASWQCQGADCFSPSTFSSSTCVRYFCTPTLDVSMDPRYNATLTSSDGLRLGDTLSIFQPTLLTRLVNGQLTSTAQVGQAMPVGCADVTHRLYHVDTSNAPDFGINGSVFAFLAFQNIPLTSSGYTNFTNGDGATCAPLTAQDPYYGEKVPAYLDMVDRQSPWFQYQSLYDARNFSIHYERGFFSCQPTTCLAPVISAPHLSVFDASGTRLTSAQAGLTYTQGTTLSLGCDAGYEVWRVYTDVHVDTPQANVNVNDIKQEILTRLDPAFSDVTLATTTCVEQGAHPRLGTSQMFAFDGTTELTRVITRGVDVIPANGKWFRHTNRTGGVQYGYYECRPYQCITLLHPAVGTTVSATVVNFGDHIQTTCDAGYQWETSLAMTNGTSTCGTDGVLSPAPRCIQYACPTQYPADAYPFHGNAGDTVTVTCAPGYMYSTSATAKYTATCYQNHTWSNPVSRCYPAHCVDVVAPPHGYLNDGINLTSQYQEALNNAPGARVALFCDLNYEPSDVARQLIVCQNNGTWNASIPLCVPTQCGALPSRDHASIKVSRNTVFNQWFPVNTTATVTCDTGYGRTLGYGNGTSAIISCVRKYQGAVWSQDFPNCTAVACPVSGLTTLSSSVTYTNLDSTGLSVSWTCPPNKHPAPNSIPRVNCDITSSKWKPVTPISCLDDNCPVLQVPSGGQLSATTGPPGTMVRLSCLNAKQQYVYKSTHTCTSDLTWSPGLPVCFGSNSGGTNSGTRHHVSGIIMAILFILLTILSTYIL